MLLLYISFMTIPPRVFQFPECGKLSTAAVICRELWKNEESFRITKSDLETRPVYLSRKDHTAAHFLICFISLVVARLLEKRLDRKHSSFN
ncbi:MAG: hypothetical protein KAQ69_05440 [Spirochaetales bacterium]|nr:hypothetical protein [Spirochaetales bacterium]